MGDFKDLDYSGPRDLVIYGIRTCFVFFFFKEFGKAVELDILITFHVIENRSTYLDRQFVKAEIEDYSHVVSV